MRCRSPSLGALSSAGFLCKNNSLPTSEVLDVISYPYYFKKKNEYINSIFNLELRKLHSSVGSDGSDWDKGRALMIACHTIGLYLGA